MKQLVAPGGRSEQPVIGPRELREKPRYRLLLDVSFGLADASCEVCGCIGDFPPDGVTR